MPRSSSEPSTFPQIKQSNSEIGTDSHSSYETYEELRVSFIRRAVSFNTFPIVPFFYEFMLTIEY